MDSRVAVRKSVPGYSESIQCFYLVVWLRVYQDDWRQDYKAVIQIQIQAMNNIEAANRLENPSGYMEGYKFMEIRLPAATAWGLS